MPAGWPCGAERSRAQAILPVGSTAAALRNLKLWGAGRASSRALLVEKDGPEGLVAPGVRYVVADSALSTLQMVARRQNHGQGGDSDSGCGLAEVEG